MQKQFLENIKRWAAMTPYKKQEGPHANPDGNVASVVVGCYNAVMEVFPEVESAPGCQPGTSVGWMPRYTSSRERPFAGKPRGEVGVTPRRVRGPTQKRQRG